MGTDNGNGERRQGLFYRKMFWGLLGSAALIFISATGVGYTSLDTRLRELDKDKLDKQAFMEMLQQMKETNSEFTKRIDGKLNDLNETIRALWRARPASRPHE